ncbi:MAG: NusA-like transcription termination signal-binding factor [Candidatus Nanohaloarchaea archaeon]|nr:NusA-like transcription termination signal-binding factor [Candidatus Nanohaloarchaea archaeon]
MSITFDSDTIRKINVFEEITGVEVQDCIINEDSAHFVVPDDKVGMAVGKGGSTIQRVQDNLDMDVRVYGYADDIEAFVDNIVPADINSVAVEDDGDEEVAVIHVDGDQRSRVVGRGGETIDIVERFLQKEFDVDSVRVE